MDDIYYMKQAILQAKKAAREDEVPVGAVLVLHDKIIARGHNKKEQKQNATLHAEMIVLQKGYKKLGTWRLNDCTLYVTLEPCIMCMGALLHSRVARVVFGTRDPKGGAVYSNLKIEEVKNLNHKIEFTENILQSECSSLLKEYFKSRR